MAVTELDTTYEAELRKGRTFRKIRESVTAYLFLLPAFLIIAVFGLFPMFFSIYVSLHRWRIIPGHYMGLQNYVRGIDNLAYLVFFWVVVLLLFFGGKKIKEIIEKAREHSDSPWFWALPGLMTAAGILLFVRFFVTFLPGVLDIGEQVKGMVRTQGLFNELLREAWLAPEVQAAFWLSIGVLIGSFVIVFLMTRYIPHSRRWGSYYSAFMLVFLFIAAASALGWLTWTEIQGEYAAAIEAGEELAIWSQMVMISLGMVLLYAGWKLWSSAAKNPNSALLLRIGGAIGLMIAAWILIAELPEAIAAGDAQWWQGLQVTTYYSLFTVPVQLALSLFLATLLFQDIKGKSFFRLIYFLPYITNPVAAARIFRVLFSSRTSAPINNIITTLGISPLMWLDEPRGIFQMLAPGLDLSGIFAGPSLALIVIVIYNIWTFVGYNTVIFLAGLGSIPSDLYEAAAVDGGGRWAQFRNITIPLLSPTTYYLTLIAIIGTFKAFTHVWVLRSGAALGTTDTASIRIFIEFNRNSRYGYASSLALILLGVVLILTVINNYVAREKVFYG